MFKLMAVDDDKYILATMQRSLRHLKNFQVDTFNDPQAAIEHARNTRYDIFLSDYMMPGLDGISFLSKIKSLQPDSIRIILSGKDDKDTVIKATNAAGLFRFISKPVKRDDLIETINQALKTMNQSV